MIRHPLIPCLVFCTYIRSSHFLVKNGTHASVYSLGFHDLSRGTLLLRPHLFEEPASHAIILLRAFLHTLLFAARRLFALCTLMSHDTVPVNRLCFTYFILRKAESCSLCFAMQACNLHAPRGRLLYLLYSTRRIPTRPSSRCLPCEAFIPFFSQLTLLLWPNILPSFVARGNYFRCLVVVKPILIDPFAVWIHCTSRWSGYLYNTL